MKASSVLKVLGAAAVVAALTPYEVKKDEETGATKIRALLWGAKYTPATEETGRDVDVILGLHIPKLPGGTDEAELFADDEPELARPDGDLSAVTGAADGAGEAFGTEDGGEVQEAADETAESVAVQADDDDESGSEF